MTVALRQDAGNRSTAGEDVTFDRVRRRPIIIGADNQTAVTVTSRCGYTNEPELATRSAADRESSSDDVDDGTADGDDDADDDNNIEDVDGGGIGANRRGSHRGTHRRRQRRQPVCVLWNRVPEEITLGEDAQVTSVRFVMTVDARLSVAKREIMSGECGLCAHTRGSVHVLNVVLDQRMDMRSKSAVELRTIVEQCRYVGRIVRASSVECSARVCLSNKCINAIGGGKNPNISSRCARRSSAHARRELCAGTR